MSIDKSYLELALANINDGQSKDDIVSLINEALKQASTNVENVEVKTNGIATVFASSNPMTMFMGLVDKHLTCNSKKKGKPLAKDYLNELLKYAESQNTDYSVIEDLKDFLIMFD